MFAKKACWLNPSDVKKLFSSASFVAKNRIVFNIFVNKYRLIVKMAFESRRIYIRFVGTHQRKLVGAGIPAELLIRPINIEKAV
ncbi:MAG: type II toxin-antitoxin system HigB family toxin [Candidatus Riflebacteria bacterium]|nr:type II toxin-antitoxin system HigB family toxin [Candidatus Riflebacteria bacterium]